MALRVFFRAGHQSHIHIVSSDFQFVENDILHRMVILQLAKIQPCVSQADIREIIFQWSVDIFFPFYIVSLCLIDQKRITEIIQILFNGYGTYDLPLHALERIGELFGIGERADCRGYDIEQVFQFILIAYVISPNDVLDISLLEQPLQK